MSVEETAHIGIWSPSEHGRSRDLVLIQMQDRQHCTVSGRIEKTDALPGPLEWPGLRLAVPNHARHQQVRVVEGSTKCMNQRIPELPTLVNRSRRRHAHVARNPARCRELTDEPGQPGLVLCHLGIDFGVGALEVHIRHQRRAAMSWTGDIDDVRVVAADQPVEMGVDETQPWRRAPMAEQSRFDVRGLEPLAQERIRLQVDLCGRQVIGSVPVVDKAAQLRVADDARFDLGRPPSDHTPNHHVQRPFGVATAGSEIVISAITTRCEVPEKLQCATVTDILAVRISLFDTLPTSMTVRLEMPLRPTTMRSAPASSANSMILRGTSRVEADKTVPSASTSFAKGCSVAAATIALASAPVGSWSRSQPRHWSST